MKRMQQRHGIQPAGDGNEDFLPARERTARLDFAFEALKEFAHTVMLLFFCTLGKRLAVTFAPQELLRQLEPIESLREIGGLLVVELPDAISAKGVGGDGLPIGRRQKICRCFQNISETGRAGEIQGETGIWTRNRANDCSEWHWLQHDDDIDGLEIGATPIVADGADELVGDVVGIKIGKRADIIGYGDTVGADADISQ